jgi:hypothetical protein
LNVNKLIALAFVPVDDVTRAYSLIIMDFDQDADELLEYFEKPGSDRRKHEVNTALLIYTKMSDRSLI